MDLAVARRVLARDRAAFHELFLQHQGPFLRVARAALRDPAAAEEVVQDSWIAILEALPRFEGRSSLKTWMFRIVLNRARSRSAHERFSVPISALVRDGVDDDLPRELPAAAVACPPEEAPDRLLERAAVRRAVERAIAALPERQRLAVMLHDVEGLPAEAICGRLGVNAANLRVLLHRGRARVRALVEEQAEAA
jgi:RNA polymerase sigma-70 factor (ECF subfamily)